MPPSGHLQPPATNSAGKASLKVTPAQQEAINRYRTNAIEQNRDKWQGKEPAKGATGGTSGGPAAKKK